MRSESRDRGGPACSTGVDAVMQLHGQHHLLPHPIHLANDDYWEAVLATNTTSMFRAMRAELFQFVQQSLGHRDNRRGLRPT